MASVRENGPVSQRKELTQEHEDPTPPLSVGSSRQRLPSPTYASEPFVPRLDDYRIIVDPVTGRGRLHIEESSPAEQSRQLNREDGNALHNLASPCPA